MNKDKVEVEVEVEVEVMDNSYSTSFLPEGQGGGRKAAAFAEIFF